MKSRRGFAIQRLMNAMRQAHADGWFIVFDTLIDEAVPSFVSGAMAKAGKVLLEGTLQAGTSAVSDKLLDLVGLGGKSAADKGKDTRDYLAAAFPELNAWERAGADASSAGMVDAGFENQKEL